MRRALLFFVSLLAVFSVVGWLGANAEAKDRPPVVKVVGAIDGDMVEAAEKVLDGVKLGAAVTIRIDSPGGSVFAALRLIDAVERAHVRATCEVGAYAASGAAVVLESPACGVRVVHPWSVIMFHRAAMQVGAAGTSKIRESLASLEAVDRAIALVVSRRVGKTPEEYLAWTASEQWMTGAEAVKSGFADKETP